MKIEDKTLQVWSFELLKIEIWGFKIMILKIEMMILEFWNWNVRLLKTRMIKFENGVLKIEIKTLKVLKL